jgi:hypothetical protein
MVDAITGPCAASRGSQFLTRSKPWSCDCGRLASRESGNMNASAGKRIIFFEMSSQRTRDDHVPKPFNDLPNSESICDAKVTESRR